MMSGRNETILLIVGGLLVSAALAKSAGQDLLSPTISTVAEFSLGICVIAARRCEWTSLGVAAVFTMFFGYSLSRALAGESSCGCFGDALRISPWLTTALDLAIVGALARTVVKAPIHTARRGLLFSSFPIALGVGVVMSLSARAAPKVVSEENLLQLVRIASATRGSLDDAEQLFFVDSRCGSCQEMLMTSELSRAGVLFVHPPTEEKFERDIAERAAWSGFIPRGVQAVVDVPQRRYFRNRDSLLMKWSGLEAKWPS